jgi:hypothetical protein
MAFSRCCSCTVVFMHCSLQVMVQLCSSTNEMQAEGEHAEFASVSGSQQCRQKKKHFEKNK